MFIHESCPRGRIRQTVRHCLIVNERGWHREDVISITSLDTMPFLSSYHFSPLLFFTRDILSFSLWGLHNLIISPSPLSFSYNLSLLPSSSQMDILPLLSWSSIDLSLTTESVLSHNLLFHSFIHSLHRTSLVNGQRGKESQSQSVQSFFLSSSFMLFMIMI